MAEKPTRSRRILKVVLIALLTVVLTGVFYIAVVMGQPQTDATDKTRMTKQALLEPLASPLTIGDAPALKELAAAFPAPVMYMSHRSLTFVKGECADVPFEDGVARVVTLTYRTADYDTLTVQSIYPARALSLLGKDGRTFMGIIHDKMAGYDYVAMKDAATCRLHAQGEEALYVFTTPLVELGVLDQWTNGLQLYRPDPGE